MFSFGSKQPSRKDRVRDVKRQTRTAQRDLDREIRELERSEAKTIVELKRMAKRGDQAGLRVLAKELVRVRKARARLLGAKSSVGSVATRVTVANANAAAIGSLGTASRAMASAGIDPEALRGTLQAFEQTTARMSMTDEMIDEAFEAMDGEEVEEEADEVTDQVLAEIGVDVGAQLDAAPTAAVAGTAVDAESDAEMERMLAELGVGK